MSDDGRAAQPQGADESALQARYREALAVHRAGDLDAAEAAYRAILERLPASFHALHMLGALRGQRGDWAEAERLIARAVEIDPDVAAAHANLGNARRLLGRREEALASYARALELQPYQARALKGRGLLLWEDKRPEEALAAYNALLMVEPEYADGWFVRGACLDRLGMHEAALASYRTGLGLPHASDSEKLRFLVAAKGSGEAPPAAPADYVQTLFDIYAHIFDQHLVGDLAYRAPEQLVEALRPHLPPAPFDVLDVGCGTGLCGALLRPFARRLTGVDLSPAMIEQAGRKHLYDELAQGELTGWMAAHPCAFDLIVATDVFIYIGDLAPVLAAARAALRPARLLGFTTERGDAAATKLQPNLRYAHSPGYVQELAAAGGWRIEEQRDAILRREKNEDVAGQIIVLRSAP
jgi:predicted TPR repeat methyltransferase